MFADNPTTPAAPAPPKGYKQAENVDDSIKGTIDALLDVADDLDTEKDALGKRVTANRSMLRGFVDQGLATPEQAGEIVAKYPARERKPKADTKS